MSDESIREYPNPDRLRYYAKDYGDYHAAHPKIMPGKMLNDEAQRINNLVQGLKRQLTVKGIDEPIRLLDYGSGKGYQYLRQRIHERWGGILPYCYDPGVIHLSERPSGFFDGIICTDVLEHIEERDVPDVLADIFNYTYADRPSFVYLHICCRPAGKHFPDGRNFHATVKPPKWWDRVVKIYARPGVMLELSYEEAVEEPAQEDPDV